MQTKIDEIADRIYRLSTTSPRQHRAASHSISFSSTPTTHCSSIRGLDACSPGV